MKIHEILTEAKALTSQEIAQIIIRDCAPFLSLIGNAPLSNRIWRGTLKKIPFFSKQKCPVNRKPRDTDPEVSKIVDDWFLDNMGVRFRSNATFGTGDYHIVDDYGLGFTVLPIGEFDYCWSPRVKDMTYDLLDEVGATGDNPELISDLVAGARYVMNKNLPAAIRSGHEIMIYCPNGFYMLHHSLNEQSPSYGKDDAILKYVQNPAAMTMPVDNSAKIAQLTSDLKFAQERLETMSNMVTAFKHALTLPFDQRYESVTSAGVPNLSDRYLEDAALAQLVSHWSNELAVDKKRATQLANKLKKLQQ